MKKMVCDKGHFYDGEKFSSCPVCQNELINKTENEDIGDVAVSENIEKDDEKPSKKSIFSGLFHSKDKAAKNSSEEMDKKKEHITVQLEDDASEENSGDASVVPNQNIARRGETILLWQEEEEETPKPLENTESPKVSEIPKAPEPKFSSGKTVAFYDMEEEPVTGFLICEIGEEKGKSYTLKTGQNFIGRAPSMDVVLENEMSVSRIKHAVILYEPKKREFYVQSGESSGLTYLNDNLVTSLCLLSAYDRIQLGECTLVFLPLCGEKFSWD